jgi:hypothetical protein
VNAKEVYGIVIKDATILNRSLALTLDCEVPDPSWEYSHYETLWKQDTINLKVYAKQRSVDGAPAVLVSIVAKILLQMPSSGSYTIHYKAGYTYFKDSTFAFN